MLTPELIQQILALKPQERFQLLDLISNSLDESDPALEDIWANEAVRRLRAVEEGKAKRIPAEVVFGTQK